MRWEQFHSPGTVEVVQNVRSESLSKPFAVGRRSPGASTQRVLVAGFVAPAAWLLAGCGSGGDLISTVALPSQETTGYAEDADLPFSPEGRQSGKPDLNPAQVDYLSALASAGIHSSNDLRALSIGSYVCQARAAGQSDQTVWDSVAPMVRSNVIDVSAGAPRSPAVTNVDTIVGNFIQIATQKLC